MELCPRGRLPAHPGRPSPAPTSGPVAFRARRKGWDRASRCRRFLQASLPGKSTRKFRREIVFSRQAGLIDHMGRWRAAAHDAVAVRHIHPGPQPLGKLSHRLPVRRDHHPTPIKENRVSAWRQHRKALAVERVLVGAARRGALGIPVRGRWSHLRPALRHQQRVNLELSRLMVKGRVETFRQQILQSATSDRKKWLR